MDAHKGFWANPPWHGRPRDERVLTVIIDPLPNFAKNLRRARIEKGLSQSQLATGAMMDPAEVRRLESGRRDPGIRVVARLAKGLDIEPHELLLDITRPA